MSIALHRCLSKYQKVPLQWQAFSSGVFEPKKLEEDLLGWDHLLTEEENAVRTAARNWVHQSFLPHFAEAPTFPLHLVPGLARLGALGSTLQGHGGACMGNVANGLLMQELERGDSGLRKFCMVQSSLVMHSISEFGSEEQRRNYLPHLSRGTLLGCFALLEGPPESGAIRTVATKDKDTYILNGVKCWVEGSIWADLAIIWARVIEEDGNLRGFVVDRRISNFATPAFEDGVAQQIFPSGDIHLEDCRVPASSLLPGSSGFRSPLACLMQARESIGWGVTGAAMECYHAALHHGLSNRASGRPVAQCSLFQSQLAEMAGKLVASQLLSLHCGRLKDMGRLSPLQVSLHKQHNVGAAQEVAAIARRLMGLQGSSSVMRHSINIELASSSAGTQETLALALGRGLTGLQL